MIRPEKLVNCVQLSLLYAAVLTFVIPVCGQENIRYVEVNGAASVSKPANLVKIRMTIAAKGDSAKASVKDFKRIRQSFIDQMGPMNFPEVTLKFQQPKVQSGASADMFEMMNGPFVEEAAEASEDEFDCREDILLEMAVDEDPIKMLEEVSRVIDASLEAKAKLPDQTVEMIYQGESTEDLLQLTRSDLDELKKQATRMAFENAKKKAEELAAISGGKIGKVLQISGQGQSEDAALAFSWGYGFEFGSESNPGQAVEVAAYLTVRFELTD